MKLSLEDKIEIVRLYEEVGLGYKSISKKFNVRSSAIEMVIRRYKEHEIESLKHPHKNRSYSSEFKMMIIKKVYEGKSKTSLAVEYNLPGSGTIVAWMHKYEELGYKAILEPNSTT